jgi:hypothetical protein
MSVDVLKRVVAARALAAVARFDAATAFGAATSDDNLVRKGKQA